MDESNERITRVTELGQSFWLDSLSRRMIESGQLAGMIARGDIRGMTSNPTIFNQAIGKSQDYDSALMPLAWAGWEAEDIFWQLAIEDVTSACDLFRPLYDETDGGDGFVSIEVSPLYAHDTSATISQVRKLWQTINRPNLMVKIPATKEGIPAIRDCISEGININVTLIFSLQRYDEVMDAYFSGLKNAIQTGKPVNKLASVASFFVSRVDTKVDGGLPDNSPLRGKAGIANAKLAYRQFEQFFNNEGFAELQTKHGARKQRPLWASTSTKNPAYADTLYADNLIGPLTIDTIPPKTLEAFRDHGKPEITITTDVDGAATLLDDLKRAGIDMVQVTQELEDEGVKLFDEAFNELLSTIDSRRQKQLEQIAPMAQTVAGQIAKLEQKSVPVRLYKGDSTLWTSDSAGQAEIRQRLGWLNLPSDSRSLLEEIGLFIFDLSEAGFTHALLLGMGGSSLAPEVMSLMFGEIPHYQNQSSFKLQLAILDSTDPVQVLETERKVPIEKTLFILSSKSGGTAEVSALYNYFWERTKQKGDQWIAITDPGTSLEELARKKGFRHVFYANPQVGGRYSALTAFGMVPAALMGIDGAHLLDRAEWMAAQCDPRVPTARNPGLALGAFFGQAALTGRDKLTILADPLFAPFGAWAEQLIAESSGKQGKGIIPIVDEPLASPEVYGNDRLFVYLRSDGQYDIPLKMLHDAGNPVIVLPVADAYDLGAEYYRWEVAIAIACSILGVNAFDQPDVQDSKDRTKAKIAAYIQNGRLDSPEPIVQEGNISAFSPQPADENSLKAVLDRFFDSVGKDDYIGINAYLPRNSRMTALLSELRSKIRERTRCATTLGFGPRFLHSTGQLHKGGPAEGAFLQITMEPSISVQVPNQGFTFGVLEQAQALGDYEALVGRGRRILRIHLSNQDSFGELLRAV